MLYDEGLTPLIADQLRRNASVITPLSRSQLLDDYFNLAYRGKYANMYMDLGNVSG